MATDIREILSNHASSEPPEFAIIRNFVMTEFGETPELQLQSDNIVIAVSGSVLAGALRLQISELEKVLNSDYGLIIKSV